MHSINIPMYEKAHDGSILANYVFHRPYSRIHSRCIEYPWCASNYNGEMNILDVGSAKSDLYWIKWLEGLDANVYVADYDVIDYKSDKLKKVQCDIRKTDFEDNFFDIVFAVSVLEHIGLANPQVNNQEKPIEDELGDVQAFRELIRVLKPGGRLFLTVPFSEKHKLIFGESARCYSLSTIGRYNLPNVRRTNFDIYQYLPVHERMLSGYSSVTTEPDKYLCELPGLYRWKRVYSIKGNMPQFRWCVDCVAMASYTKISDVDEDKAYYKNYLTACNYIANSEMIKYDHKYLLYGTGGYSALVTQFVQNLGGHVACYSDTDPSKWGTVYLGKPVIPPGNIVGLKDSVYKIIIASSLYDEISVILRNLGFKTDEDFLYYSYLNIQDILTDSSFERIAPNSVV